MVKGGGCATRVCYKVKLCDVRGIVVDVKHGHVEWVGGDLPTIITDHASRHQGALSSRPGPNY